MARTYNWSRGASGLAITPAGKAAFFGGLIPAGATLERVIFGYSLWVDGYWGGLVAGPGKLSLLLGIRSLLESTGQPVSDPGDGPGLDWLWAGMITGRIEPLHRATNREYRLQFSTDVAQIDVETRRRNDAAEGRRVWAITDTLATVDTAFSGWGGASYMSVLYSEPG